MSGNFTESIVEQVALAWIESLGYAVKHGPEIGPEEVFAERTDYGQVVLAGRSGNWCKKCTTHIGEVGWGNRFQKGNSSTLSCRCG